MGPPLRLPPHPGRSLLPAMTALLLLHSPAAAQYPDPGGSDCDPYDELRCRGGYDWTNCRCKTDTRTPPPGRPPGPRQPVRQPTTRPWRPGNLAALPATPLANGGATYWATENRFVINNPVSGTFTDLPLAAEWLGEFQSSVRVQLWGLQPGTGNRPVAGVTLDPVGRGSSGEGTIFFGKTDQHLVVDQLQGNRWVPLTRFYIAVNPSQADLFQIVRTDGALRFYFNGYEVAALGDQAMRPVSLELYVGGGSVGAYREWWLYQR